MRFVRVVLCLLTGAALVTAAPAHAAPDRRQAALDAAVAAGIPGMTAVAPDWRGSAGRQVLDRRGTPDPSGQFRVGSVSKTFTATVVLQLVAEHRLGLEDVVQQRLPGLLPYPEPITVRQLLQHTAGVPRDLPLEHSWATAEELDTERFVHFDDERAVRLSTTQPLLFAPGTGWAYSNTGYNILGLLVEHVTGKPLARVLYERIARPLGLHSTFLPGDFPFVPRPAAHGYEQAYPAPHPLTDVTTYNYSRYLGAGQLISSGPDLNHFLSALLGGRLLPPALLDAMKTTVPGVDTTTGLDEGFDYGLGLMRVDLTPLCGKPTVVWGHGGDVPGFNTLSFKEQSGPLQVTTLATLDLTANTEQAGLRQVPMVSEFCAFTPRPKATGAPERLFRLTL
ncbi:serine hydrolase domain-containing protein [Amycolatopsis jiangsuensis]|uniref:D-alanyl-D-alanine carboxypeptidase n=1 Tax=Amycolatopsis jiangsuensis TaxID=1181879 RepID=A0A840IYG7_9PSEU|nr:serine hydrolase domain-containing protein [Amycolatopsis jiangsuensis]MBB4686252.1 D-alanyl-D-alanine carboxypeptidase [Amycolatopsis jiangsuensis]